MLSRLPTRTGRILSRVRPISTEARTALTNAEARAAAAIQAKAAANIAALEAMRRRQSAITEVEKSVAEGQSILKQQGVYQAKPESGSSSSSGYNASNIAMGIGALASLGIAIKYITDEQAKKEEASVKDELEVLKGKGIEGLNKLDGEIYDLILNLKELGILVNQKRKDVELDTNLPDEIRKKLLVFRSGLAEIPLSSGHSMPLISHPEISKIRAQTVADAIILLHQYRVISGSLTKGWTGWDEKAPPNGKKIFDLSNKFSKLTEIASPSSTVMERITKEKRLEGGSAHRSKKRSKRRSRKSRKSRSRK